MKSFRIDFDEAISHDNVEEAILKPSLGKRNREDVAKILAELELNAFRICSKTMDSSRESILRM